MMPGVNCSVLGCGSCRRSKGIGIFKLPVAKGSSKMAHRLARRGNESTFARNISNPRILKYVSIALFPVTL